MASSGILSIHLVGQPSRRWPPPCTDAGYVTFGVFNKPEKINTQTVSVWAKILNNVPASMLFLKYFNFYDDPMVRGRLLHLFEEQGISRDRLRFGAGYDTRGSHLQLYARTDIMLDPFPLMALRQHLSQSVWGFRLSLSGATHLSAGWQGPCCAILGRWASPLRVTDQYVDIATSLAQDPKRLVRLRNTLRQQTIASPLLDPAKYAQEIERAFREMWRQRCVRKIGETG